MRNNTDMILLVLGIGLIYWGFKIVADAGKNLDSKYIELYKKQKIMNPFVFILYLSPIALSYVFLDIHPKHLVEIFMFALFYFFAFLGGIYLSQVKKLVTLGYPNWYINKFRISQVVIDIGIFIIVGTQLVRLVQRYG